MTTTNPPAFPPASVPKRLLSICYDALLLVAVLFLAMAALLIILQGHSPKGGNPLMSGYLLLVSYLFFGWFWTHGGQTLGMRAWKLKLQPADGHAVSWQQAGIRFLTALPAWLVTIIGIAEVSSIPLQSHAWLHWLEQLPDGLVLLAGVIWLLMDQRPGNWREKLSGTEVIQLKQRTEVPG